MLWWRYELNINKFRTYLSKLNKKVYGTAGAWRYTQCITAGSKQAGKYLEITAWH